MRVSISKFSTHVAFLTLVAYTFFSIFLLLPFETPDLASYLKELKDFDFGQVRLDYGSWMLLKSSGASTQNTLRAFVILCFACVIASLLHDVKRLYIVMFSLLPVFPMIIASQLRLGLAILLFLLVIVFTKKWLIAIGTAGIFHSSFLAILFFPVLTLSEYFASFFTYIPGVQGKLLAYVGEKSEINLAPDLILLSSVQFLLLIQLKFRIFAFAVLSVIALNTFGYGLSDWEARRRLIEVSYVIFNPFLLMYLNEINLQTFMKSRNINKYIVFAYITGLVLLVMLNTYNFLPKIK